MVHTTASTKCPVKLYFRIHFSNKRHSFSFSSQTQWSCQHEDFKEIVLKNSSVQKEKPHKHEEVAASNKLKLKGRRNNRDQKSRHYSQNCVFCSTSLASILLRYYLYVHSSEFVIWNVDYSHSKEKCLSISSTEQMHHLLLVGGHETLWAVNKMSNWIMSWKQNGSVSLVTGRDWSPLFKTLIRRHFLSTCFLLCICGRLLCTVSPSAAIKTNWNYILNYGNWHIVLILKYDVAKNANTQVEVQTPQSTSTWVNALFRHTRSANVTFQGNSVSVSFWNP